LDLASVVLQVAQILLILGIVCGDKKLTR